MTTTTPEAARFRAEVEVPDPPPSPRGRSRYWDDTVTDAVAELRKRLREGGMRSDHALVMIIDLEKTRIRHGQCISGTFVPCLPDLDDDWGNPLPTVCPDPPPVCREASPSASADALGDASRQTGGGSGQTVGRGLPQSSSRSGRQGTKVPLMHWPWRMRVFSRSIIITSAWSDRMPPSRSRFRNSATASVTVSSQ